MGQPQLLEGLGGTCWGMPLEQGDFQYARSLPSDKLFWAFWVVHQPTTRPEVGWDGELAEPGEQSAPGLGVQATDEDSPSRKDGTCGAFPHVQACLDLIYLSRFYHAMGWLENHNFGVTSNDPLGCVVWLGSSFGGNESAYKHMGSHVALVAPPTLTLPPHSPRIHPPPHTHTLPPSPPRSPPPPPHAHTPTQPRHLLSTHIPPDTSPPHTTHILALRVYLGQTVSTCGRPHLPGAAHVDTLRGTLVMSFEGPH